jgi:hypothetical protein
MLRSLSQLALPAREYQSLRILWFDWKELDHPPSAFSKVIRFWRTWKFGQLGPYVCSQIRAQAATSKFWSKISSQWRLVCQNWSQSHKNLFSSLPQVGQSKLECLYPSLIFGDVPLVWYTTGCCLFYYQILQLNLHHWWRRYDVI